MRLSLGQVVRSVNCVVKNVRMIEQSANNRDVDSCASLSNHGFIPFRTQGKACVCGTPLSFRITELLSNCCSHNPSPLESSKKTPSACGCVCCCCYCACGGCFAYRPSTRTFQTIEPLRGKKATTLRDGLFLLMEELTSLMEKQQLVGAPSPGHPREGYLSCLVQSLPLRHILRMPELHSIPKALLKYRVSLRLHQFLELLALSPAIHKSEFSMTPSMRPTFVRLCSNPC